MVGRLQRDAFGPYFKCINKSSRLFTGVVIWDENIIWKLSVLSENTRLNPCGVI